MSELKPCPFCGSKKIECLESNIGGFSIECYECDFYVGGNLTPLGVVTLWNTRTELAELEKLRAENARLTEIATEEATRMHELYEALVAVVESHGWSTHEGAIDTASEVLNKTSPLN